MRIGIVGFGKMGMLHGALLNKIQGVDVVAITDKSKLVLKAFKSVLPHIKTFTSYEKMMDRCQLDGVIIATPSFSHVPIAKYALKNNLHIFVEKPMSSSMEDAIDLYNETKGKKVISMIGFSSRHIPTFEKGKEIIESKILGEITSVNAKIYIADVFSEQNGWRYKKKVSGGGVLIDVGVHLIDLLYWYFGDVKSVSGKTVSLYSKEVEDEVTAQLIFKTGLKADIDCSWSKEGYRKLYIKIEVEGENGSLVITDQNVNIILKENDTHKEMEKTQFNYADLYKGYYIDIGEPQYSEEIKQFIDAIKSNSKVETDVVNGLHVQKIINSIYISSNEGRSIELNGDEDNG